MGFKWGLCRGYTRGTVVYIGFSRGRLEAAQAKAVARASL